MLSVVSRRGVTCAVSRLEHAYTATRGMAMEGMKGWSDKEQAVENIYFSKEDERLLSKLLSKVKQQTKVSDVSEASQSAVAEEAALRNIVSKYRISKEDFQALLDWKHAHY
eukprot:GHRR01000882.1.p1 GENE.GHRR01000882.1~~GHRR01000882.1.p1  ORF type:complete len:111 (+),score=32.80 GHRR01000882.1:112-444(+)